MSTSRIGQRRCDDVAGGHLHTAHLDRLGRHELELLQRLQHVDVVVPEAVLERHPRDVDPARDQDVLRVLDVDARQRADPLRDREDLRLFR